MNTQFEKFVEPLKEINNLTVKNIETVVDMQLKNVEETAKVGLEQVKGVSAINDADSWKSYLNTQAEVTQQFNERLVENARTVVELGNAFTNEVQQIVKAAFAVK